MSNPILAACIKSRGGHYHHDLEVNSVEDIQSTCEAIAEEGWDLPDLIEFFDTMTIHYLGEDPIEEKHVHDFSTTDYLNSLS